MADEGFMDFQPLQVGEERLSLIKVPAWLSKEWMQTEAGTVVGQMDGKTFTVNQSASTSESTTTKFEIVKRPTQSVYCFKPENNSHVVELVTDNITIRPNLTDASYRNLLSKRKEEGALINKGHRTVHTERKTVVNSMDKTPTRIRQEIPVRKRSREDLFEAVRDFLERYGHVGQSYKAIQVHTDATKSQLDECLAVGCDLRPLKPGAPHLGHGYFLKERYKKRKL